MVKVYLSDEDNFFLKNFIRDELDSSPSEYYKRRWKRILKKLEDAQRIPSR